MAEKKAKFRKGQVVAQWHFAGAFVLITRVCRDEDVFYYIKGSSSPEPEKNLRPLTSREIGPRPQPTKRGR